MACYAAVSHYTDNSMHDLKAERFYKQEMANGMMMAADGPIKTFPLRGIKDSPTYLHDGRCFTLEDTEEYFNLVLQLPLDSAGEEGRGCVPKVPLRQNNLGGGSDPPPFIA